MKLELHHADCGYGRTRILSGASIRLQSGEIVCFLGPNGVGKTTLFKSMLGLLPLLSGEVLLDGTDRKRISDRSFARKVAYVPQSHIRDGTECASLPARLPLEKGLCDRGGHDGAAWNLPAAGAKLYEDQRRGAADGPDCEGTHAGAGAHPDG